MTFRNRLDLLEGLSGLFYRCSSLPDEIDYHLKFKEDIFEFASEAFGCTL